MKRTINTTLVLIFQNNKVLLAQKKRGFAQGTFNGIGGKQDPGETIEQAMIRETQEEIGVTPTEYCQVGLIRFDTWYKGERVDLNLNIFTCSDFVGEIEETEEMILNGLKLKMCHLTKCFQTTKSGSQLLLREEMSMEQFSLKKI